MEENDLNKSIGEELFRRKLEVTVVPDCFEKSGARRQKACLYGTFLIAMKRNSTIEEMVQKMNEFGRIKKNMFLPIREGIARIKATPQRYRIHGGLGRII